MPLQELSESIGIKLADFRFSRNICFLVQISRGANAVWLPADVRSLTELHYILQRFGLKSECAEN